MTTVRFESPTWDEVHTLLRCQASKIRADGFEVEVILGVSRGGLVAARIHSDLLENANIVTVRTECYANFGKVKSELTLKEPLSTSVDGKSVLVVDDVADTGRSLKLVKEHVVQRGARVVKIATLFQKPWSALKPDYFEKETENWVVFPWDLKETVRGVFENRGNATLSQLVLSLVNSGLPKSLVSAFLKEMAEEKPC